MAQAALTVPRMAYPYGHAKVVKPGCSRNIPCRATETALLVVDVQEYCSRPGRGLFKDSSRLDMPYFFERVDKMVSNIQRLLRAARSSNVEVIYTVIEALTSDGRDQSLDYKLSGPLLVPKGHPDAAVLPEITPLNDEIILPKTSCSVFCSTNIHYVLRNLGVRYVLVCGQLTNQCIESAVRDAADFGFLVTVPEDACAARSHDEHLSGVHNMKGFARVLTTAELESELLEQAPKVAASLRSKRSVCYLNVAYDEIYGNEVCKMVQEMFQDVGAEPFELHMCNVAQESFPNPLEVDGFLLMGSVSSCALGAQHEVWLTRLLSFLRKLIAEERPLIGVCFGHQAISLAMGGVVIQSPAGTKAGCQTYPMTAAAKDILCLHREEAKIFSHHGDAVAALPVEGMSWGYCQSGHWGMALKRCLTTQSHPEFSTKTGLKCLRKLLQQDRVRQEAKPSVLFPTLEELDHQLGLLDDSQTDYKSIALAFADLLGLLPKKKRAME